MVAGANSIFYGEALLTTSNVAVNEDDALFAALAPASSGDKARHID
jgi:biotin synthase